MAIDKIHHKGDRSTLSPISDKVIGLAIIGLGTVGSSVVKILTAHAQDFSSRIGAQIVLRGVAVRDVAKHQGAVDVDLTDDPFALIEREDVDIVIEVVGGVHPAKDWIVRALTLGKSVITANKVVIADHLSELASASAKYHADLYYEAAVAGAIPVVRPIQQSLAGDSIRRVAGIVNGTTNFILHKMEETGQSYSEALEEATELGYAEKSDPSADVEGFDAAAKSAIIASIAFHSLVEAQDVYREGITSITAEDMKDAQRLGRVIKLLSICEHVHTDEGLAISARVYPALVPLNHPIGRVDGVNNAVVVDSKYSGQLMFYGQGAGGDPTASAILGDVVMAARNIALLGRGPLLSDYANLPVIDIGQIKSRFYIALVITDKPGVLSTISAIFAHNDVSIATVFQHSGTSASTITAKNSSGELEEYGSSRLILTTHKAQESTIRQILEEVRRDSNVHKVTTVLRLEF